MAEPVPLSDSGVGIDIQNAAGNVNPLSKKLNKILETRLDNDKEMLEALKSLSGYFSENSLRSRRNLRSDIERRSLHVNEEFVDNFQMLVQQLDSVHSDVKAMNDCCQNMVSRLKAAKEQTQDLISQTTNLHAESQQLSMHADVADAFIAKYQLSAEEVKILRGTRTGQLHPEFFATLARVRQIHNDCKTLLRTNRQTTGLEVMESMALHLEAAYERLYRWTQYECRTLSGDSPDISSQLCDALLALEERPVLFGYSLEEFGTARRTAIVRGFIDALTRGGGSGATPRPIELHSHDPLRYVGDMLAWLHQASASEKEHLETLLKKCSGQDEKMLAVLDHITEGLCRPLKVRIEQVLVSEPEPVSLYKLSLLLQFYFNTISQVIKREAALVLTVEEMQTLSLKIFFNSLGQHGARLLEKVEIPPANLGPTATLQQNLQLLQDLLASHDNAVVPMDIRKQDFIKILSCLLDPVLQMCSVSASNLTAIDMATYMINCIYLIQTTLSLYEFTDQRLEMLQAQIDAHVDTLVGEQASFILNKGGLLQIYSTVQQQQISPLSSLPGLDGPSVKIAMGKFDSYLASPDRSTLQQCSNLLSNNIREMVKQRAVDLVSQAYRHLYELVRNPANQYNEPAGIMPRTPDQVTKLLTGV